MHKAAYLLIAIAAIILFASPALAACEFKPAAKDTNALLAEVPSLNTQLQACPVPLSGAVARAVGSNQVVGLQIDMADGKQETIRFTISNGALSGIERGTGTYGFLIRISQCDLDTILNAPSRAGAFAAAYTQGKLSVQAIGFWNRIKFLTAKPFLNSAMKKTASADIVFGCKKENGAICQHGGQCNSGNCVGEGQGPPWTYRCSCDPFKYMTSCPTAPPQAQPGQKLNPGQVCKHGGECRTGNCVGVGQGPPWTYQCSCDPFKFTTGC